MSKDILQNIIDDFNPESFIHFFREKKSSFRPLNREISTSRDENFSDGNFLGEIDFENKDKLIICSFKTSRSLSERSGKKLQYDEGKKILKQENSDACVFIFYDEVGNFRFSLIYTNYSGKKRDFSTFKRFTYFVSKEFTNKTFLKRIGEGDFSDLDKIKEAFSVEKVTKEFYKDIAYWYFWAVKEVRFPKDAEEEDNGRNMSVIRMITRIIFIWFMKERGLIKPDLFNYEKISKILGNISFKDTTYYKAILQNLFFATLNTKIKDRKFRFEKSFQGANKNYMDHSVYRYEDYFRDKNDMLGLFKNIPFLNGGLFDCLDKAEEEGGKKIEIRIDGFSDKEKGLNVPNELFFADETTVDLNSDYGTKNKNYTAKGLINILSSYNFVIDENDPNDAEVALDPELLGKVFENLLASFNPETSSTARKATGSYYTPREIVDYMVTQSLKEYFKTNLEASNEVEKKLDILFSAEGNTNPFDKAQTKTIVGLIEKLRIVDPAVGSGAFPMGILNKLVFILSKLDPGNIYWKEQQIKAVEKNIASPVMRQTLKNNIEEQFSDKNPDYGRKLYLIEKCIYGVDIQQIAVEIAKLRFFISLLVDENIDKAKSNWGIKPLPNLDYKIMQGNSLLEEYKGIKLIDEKILETPIDEKVNIRDVLKKRQSELQSEFIELHSKKKLTKAKEVQLKEELKKVKEQLKKLFKASEEKNNGDLFDYEKESKKLFEKIKLLREEFFIESDRKKKDKLKKNIEDIEWKFIEASLKEQNKESELDELKEVIRSNTKPYFLWHFNFGEVFREKGGFDIVIGNPPFIRAESPLIAHQRKSITESKYYKTLWEKWDIMVPFYEKSLRILNNEGINAFIASNSITTSKFAYKLQDWIIENYRIRSIDYFEDNMQIFEAGVVPVITIIQKTKREIKPIKIYRSNEFKNIERVEEIDIINSINIRERVFKKKFSGIYFPRVDIQTLGNICYISYGLRPNSDERFWKGEFKKEDLISDIKDKNHSKLYVEGKWIKKYEIETIKYLEWNTERIPKKLVRPTFPSLYDGEKLLRGRVTLGTFDDTGIVCNDSIVVLKRFLDLRNVKERSISVSISKNNFERKGSKTKTLVNKRRKELEEISKDFSIKYILAIINSKYAIAYLNNFRRHRLINYFYPDDFRNFPIAKLNLDSQQQFVILVDQILSMKSKGEDTTSLENQIDVMVYKLYELTYDEVKIVDPEFWMSESEYEEFEIK